MDKLQDHLNILDDLRIDTSSDTVDLATQGIRAINFIVKDLLGKHFWRFTEKEVTFNFYKGMREYALENNYLDMIGLYEQMNFLDPFTRVSPIQFERTMNQWSTENILSDDFTGRTSVLKVNFYNSKSEDRTIIVNSSYDGNGEWLGTGTITDVETDNNVYFTNSGSVKFTASGTGTAILTNATMANMDISNYNKKYLVKLPIYIEDASLLTSVNLKLGSSASNYHSFTATTQFNGKGFVNGLNIIGIELDVDNDTGTPDDTLFTYIQLNLAHTGTLGTVYLAEFEAITPDPLKFVYYSNDTTYDYSALTWYNKFQNADDTNNDYGAWSGKYDWFSNVVETGATAMVLEEMQEYDRAKIYWDKYNGGANRNYKGGLVGQAIDQLPSRVKKKSPPSLGFESEGISGRFDK